MSVRVSACPYAPALAGIPLKFDIGDFYENLSRKAKFIFNWEVCDPRCVCETRKKYAVKRNLITEVNLMTM